MRKDITIPEVKDVHIAIVQEYNPEFEWNDWNAYIINEWLDAIETVIVVSSGSNAEKKTSTMRHVIQHMPARSFAKVELLQEEVLQFTNEFRVSFFAEGQLFDKKFVFQENSVSPQNIRKIPVMDLKGVLGK